VKQRSEDRLLFDIIKYTTIMEKLLSLGSQGIFSTKLVMLTATTVSWATLSLLYH